MAAGVLLSQGAPFDSMVQPSVPGATKTVAVLSGIALTGISAATAYIGISYGMEKNRKTVQKILGWTVGVLGAISGIARLTGTVAELFTPAAPLAGTGR